MATRKSNAPRPAGNRRPQRPGPQRRRPEPRRRVKTTNQFSLIKWFQDLYLRRDTEFKPDSLENSFLTKIYMTRLQRLHLLKWFSLIMLLIGLLAIQDVIMSRITIFGTTTDLIPCALLLITVMEGANIGSIFILISSLFYQFSGFSPGPFCVGLLCIFGILATLFRQAYWHRNRNSIILCAGLSLMLYEIGVYGAGVALELTNWYRFPVFLITGVLSWIVMIPLYPLIDKIGHIGGNTWKD